MSNKRIAKNTIVLYVRMLFALGVSLYTSRIVLNTLGVEDFGIYNVVGGVVVMFSFLNSAMTSATQRFLSFELGKKDFYQLQRIFNMTINIHAIIAIVILVLAETVGLWVLSTKLVIPSDRVDAANWVYQFAILSFMVTIMGVPYNAFIIANERMNIYAYIGIAEVLMKLFVVFAITWLGGDGLKTYAVLNFCVVGIVIVLYAAYCWRNFSASAYYFCWDKPLYEILVSYAGWNLFGNIAAVAMGQGVNILLNIFFGPVVNSARGIAYQVNAAASGFVSNFQMAMNPQIVKSYAVGNKAHMHQLIFQGSKYSFFLMFLIVFPILVETDIIIEWWLKVVPEYTVVFCKLVLVNTLIDCISGGVMAAAQAAGKIKKYQAVVGGLLLMILPISYVMLREGGAPHVTFFVSIFVSSVALFVRLIIVAPLVDMSVLEFIRVVLARIFLVVVGSVTIFLILRNSYDVDRFCEYIKVFFNLYMDLGDNVINVLFACIMSTFSIFMSILFFGLKNSERIYMICKARVFVKNVISK